VQLGAFASQSRARALQRRVQDAGFDARLARVPGSGLVRVRVGRFDAQADADALLTRLRGLGFAATVVLDANREEGIGSEAASP
jgi:cell division protein FtsN